MIDGELTLLMEHLRMLPSIQSVGRGKHLPTQVLGHGLFFFFTTRATQTPPQFLGAKYHNERNSWCFHLQNS